MSLGLLKITHKIVEVSKKEEIFTTKGGNDDTADLSHILFERLIDKVVLCISMLGYVTSFIQSTNGIIAGAIILVFVLWFFLVI